MNSGWVTVQAIGFDFDNWRDNFWASTIDGVSWGAIYALLAVGYALGYRLTRTVSFAHAATFTVGAFGAYFTVDKLFGLGPAGSPYQEGVATVMYLAGALAVGMLAAGATATGVEAAVYLPMRHRRAQPMTLMIAGLAALVVIQEFIRVLVPKLLHGYGGSEPQRPIVLVEPKPVFSMSGADVTNVTVTIVVVALIVGVLVDVVLQRTAAGRILRAATEDSSAVTLLGVSRERVILLTSLAGGFIAGVAALLYLLKVPGGLTYSSGLAIGLKALIAAVVGGLGSVRGALLGGLVVGLAECYGRSLFGGQWQEAVPLALLLLVLMIRPKGIFGAIGERACA